MRGEATTLQAAERAVIQNALAACHGDLTLAARSLGISRSTLYRKIGSGSADHLHHDGEVCGSSIADIETGRRN